jgi:pantetheine-phosphate adenylyltransferase
MAPTILEKPLRIGIYPGTFDPITFGHMDIIQRAVKVVDQLIVGVAANAGKTPLFDLKNRVALVEADIAEKAKKNPMLGKVKVVAFDTLLMNFVVEQKASVIVRGLRAVSDFEYEFQMAGMNAKLNPLIETIFLMAADKYQLISSRFVKEIARLGGDVSYFVSENVASAMQAKFKENRGLKAGSADAPPFM